MMQERKTTPWVFSLLVALITVSTYLLMQDHSDTVFSRQIEGLGRYQPGFFELSPDLSQLVYDQLKVLSQNHGKDDDRFKRVQGLIICRKLDDLQACELRRWMPEGNLSATRVLRPAVAETAKIFAEREIKHFGGAKVGLFDVECELLSSKVPPYTKDTTSCLLTYPRAPSDIPIKGKLVDKITSFLIATDTLVTLSKELHGSLTCDQSNACKITTSNGEKELAYVIPQELAPILAKSFDHIHEQQVASGLRPRSLHSKIGSVWCWRTRYSHKGAPLYQCKLRAPGTHH